MEHRKGRGRFKNRLFVFGRETSSVSWGRADRWQPFVEKLYRQTWWTKSPYVTLFIDFNFTPRELCALFFLDRANLKVLIKIEPLTVNPLQYTKIFSRLFDYIICEKGNERLGHCHDSWQAGFDFTDCLQTDKKISLGSLIGNKKSFVAGSLYHKRIEIIERLYTSGLELEVGGRGWGESSTRDFMRGILELVKCLVAQVGLRNGWLKGLFLRETKPREIKEANKVNEFWADKDAALIIENEEHLVSEKIFDALSQNCRLVYWGGKLPNSPCILEIDEKVSSIAVREFLDKPRPNKEEFMRLRAEISRVIPTSLDSFETLTEKVRQIKVKEMGQKLIQ